MGILNNYLDKFINKKVAVVGAGISNTPLIDILLTAGIETTVRDRNIREQLGEAAVRFEKNGAKLILGENYLDDIYEDIIFRTPGLMPTNPEIIKAVGKGTELTSEIEAFFDICPCKIIAITGSDGKTTTTSIIAELLKNEGKTVHIGGNIGTPLLCDVDGIHPDDIAVIELSSFQLITMKKSPDIAVVTNLSPNHLDVHSDMDEYINAKRNIYLYQEKTDRAVFNLDNEITCEYAKTAPAGEILFFSRREKVKNGVYLENGTIFESKNGNETEIMQAEDILIPGIHNVENYLASFTAVSGIVSHDMMRSTAKTFPGVEHRIELVRELHGVKYYNDSIASSPSRAIAGIRALDMQMTEYSPENDTTGNNENRRKIILIAGGKDKGIPFDEFGAEVAARVKTLVLTGAAVNQIHEAVLKTSGDKKSNHDTNKYEPEIILCDDFNDAVQTASKQAATGDIVLLSPACTSFDKFKNFEERGKTFKDIVNGLV